MIPSMSTRATGKISKFSCISTAGTFYTNLGLLGDSFLDPLHFNCTKLSIAGGQRKCSIEFISSEKIDQIAPSID